MIIEGVEGGRITQNRLAEATSSVDHLGGLLHNDTPTLRSRPEERGTGGLGLTRRGSNEWACFAAC